MKYIDRTTYEYRKMLRIKRNARVLLRWHVKVGNIKRLPCEKCGDLPTEGHHEDYSKPLEAVWLCKPCHDLRHNVRIPMLSDNLFEIVI